MFAIKRIAASVVVTVETLPSATFADVQDGLKTVFGAVQVMRCGSNCVLAWIPQSKFVELYPHSAVSRNGVPAFESFVPPQELCMMVTSVRTDAAPIRCD